MIKQLLGCGLPIFWAGVIAFGYPGVMSAYWQDLFSVGTTETGMIVTFMLLALAVAMFFSGHVHSKVGMVKCIVIGTLLYIAAFIILFMAKNIYYLYAWAFVANLGCSFLYGPGLTTGQQMNPEKKGLISGILNLIFGVAAALMSPVLNLMLDHNGYMFVNLFLIIMIVVTNFAACILLKAAKASNAVSNAAGNSANDMTVAQALKTKEFWLIWFMWAFMGAAGISMVTLSKTYSLAIGITGVTVLTAFNLANGIIRIFVGVLTDKIGAFITGTVAFGLAAAGYFFMPHTSELMVIAICAIGVGIGFGTLFTVSGPLASDLFGLKNFGMIFGLIFTAYGFVGGIVGPAVSGMLLELFHQNYLIVFTYLGGMAFVGMALMMILKKAAGNNKKNI